MADPFTNSNAAMNPDSTSLDGAGLPAFTSTEGLMLPEATVIPQSDVVPSDQITLDNPLYPPPATGTELLGLPQQSNGSDFSVGPTDVPVPNSVSNTPLPQSDLNGVAILCARGTTMITQLLDGTAPGYYAIEEWSRYPSDATEVTSSDQAQITSFHAGILPVLFTGVRVSERDIVGAVPCLNNVKVMYTFGQNFGDVQLSGEILLGNFDDRDKASDTLKAIADFFWKYRVSNRKYPVTVSVLREKFLVYLVGIDYAEIMPDVHILPFVMHGILIDVSRDKKAAVNTPSVLISTTDVNNSSVIRGLSQRKSVLTEPANVVQTAGANNSTTSITAGGTVSPKSNNDMLIPLDQGPGLENGMTVKPVTNAPAPDTGKVTTATGAIAASGGMTTPDMRTYMQLQAASLTDPNNKSGTVDPLTQQKLDVLAPKIVSDFNKPTNVTDNTSADLQALY